MADRVDGIHPGAEALAAELEGYRLLAGLFHEDVDAAAAAIRRTATHLLPGVDVVWLARRPGEIPPVLVPPATIVADDGDGFRARRVGPEDRRRLRVTAAEDTSGAALAARPVIEGLLRDMG
jgi:hypothetical protein